ncbi:MULTISPECIES: hypothetical protein [Bradyrhizobium]|uniref:hypothetical protein n=1 Tax=Bradyrhizobium TaxID=374 RepID=UPI0003F904DF|nr:MULTISPECIES: hypothetical protein [Bradyrhizobium]QOG19732.1 hypothetical protein FOM02_22650 [Bradyrhizobium sp. SEMIA]UFW50942.1 hypothetical protein BaraCB756_07815 [Bradyrhizobium arachidis]SFV07342.1 hypothetical protein SAMN05192541_11353 [Bradyrhizobium arachidis]
MKLPQGRLRGHILKFQKIKDLEQSGEPARCDCRKVTAEVVASLDSLVGKGEQ